MKKQNRGRVRRMKLGVALVQHILILRFPIATDNGRIVGRTRLTEFAARADLIAAVSEGESTHV